MNCALLRRHIDALIDGEVDPATQIDFERHVQACAGCQEHLAFARSFRTQLREAVGDVKAPAELRARIHEAIAHAPEPMHAWVEWRSVDWKRAWPVAIAAAAVLVVGGALRLPEGSTVQSGSAGLLQDVVNLHASALPSEVPSDQAQDITRYFDDKLSFPVQPARLARRDAHLVGARLSNVRERRAAVLYYDLGGRRVTVVVFDAPEVSRAAQRERVDGHEVLYYDVGGYTVPIKQHRGLNYAFFGDVDRSSLFHLAASAQFIRQAQPRPHSEDPARLTH